MTRGPHRYQTGYACGVCTHNHNNHRHNANPLCNVKLAGKFVLIKVLT